MKKFLSILVVAVLFISCMIPTAFAAGAASFSVSSATAAPGDEVKLTVSVNNGNFATYSMNLTWDSSALEMVGMDYGSADLGNLTLNPANGIITDMTTRDKSVDGVICTVTFKVIASEAGSYSVGLAVANVKSANREDVEYGVSAGSVTVTVPECDHIWDEGKVTTSATCETAGVKTYTCTVDGCGKTKVEEISALGHAWDDGVVTTPAGCETEGVATYTCKNDSTHTKTESIAAAGHKWDESKVTTPATCETAGVQTYTCTVDGCGKTKVEEISALGHAWDEGKVTVPATCEEDGVKTYTCKNDSTHTNSEVIKATGHHWEWIVDKKATGSETGLKHEECSECGAKRNENTVIPKIEGLDDVPQTGDITPQITTAVVTVMALFAAAFVFAFKRKAV